MKSIVSFSAVVVAGRFIGFVAVMALGALPALAAKSAKQPVRRDGDPSITIYNQGVEFDVGSSNSQEHRRNLSKL
jgi:hypothetical protein